MNWQILWKAAKEPLRELVLAMLPGALAYLGTLETQWAVVLYLLLRTLDSFLHEKQKAKKVPQEGLLKLHGLTGF